MKEMYLGDGVYATYNNGMIWLDCRAQEELSEGPNGTPAIGLEPETLKALIAFANEAGGIQRDPSVRD